MFEFSALQQIPYMPSSESNNVRNRATHTLGISPDDALDCIVEWRGKDDDSGYAWHITLPNGDVYLHTDDGRFVAPYVAAPALSSAQLAEMVIQLNYFADLTNSAFDGGNLDLAEYAATFAIGIGKLLG